MSHNETIALIKSDAVGRGHTGLIIASIEYGGFQIVALRKFLPLGRFRAGGLYKTHAEKPYFDALIGSVTGLAGCVAMVLRHPDAVHAWRDFMGPTDPWTVPGHTLRHRFRGDAMPHNALHGSDSHESFVIEHDILFEGYAP